MTRCKFTCDSITKRVGFAGHPFVYDAHFSVVDEYSHRAMEHASRDDLEAKVADDKKFWAATPNGQINVGTIAADQFVVGKDYYVDFTPVVP